MPNPLISAASGVFGKLPGLHILIFSAPPMRFSNMAISGIRPTLDALVTADNILGAARRVIGACAVLGLIASGLYIRHSSAGDVFSYGAVRGLHWLLGLIVVMDSLWRLAGLFKIGRRYLASGGKPREAVDTSPGGSTTYALVALGYWATLALMLITGIEALVESRYGISILPGGLPLAWARLHGLTFFFFPAFLFLRLFYWSRVYLKEIRPYLRSP